jgi:transcriptional regulator with XRE-family HTH domain
MAEAEFEKQDGGNNVGQRLREAREARGISLEDVAARTRIPIRHLRSIEDGKYEELPALTYTVGFGRNYANEVGLDGAEIGRELREQLGGAPRGSTISTEYYAPPDPARVPSRPLAWIAGLLALALIAGYLIWRSQLGSEGEAAPAVAQQPVQQAQQAQSAAQPQPQPQAVTGQPVVLTAIGQVWLRVYEQGGATIAERTLQPGETYQIPATAARPTLRVGAPESLRVTVGQTVMPQLGPSGQPVDNVSLRPEELVARAQGQAQQSATRP